MPPTSPRRSALIIATSHYEDSNFKKLRVPGRDAESLAQVLADPEIGNFDVHRLLDKSQRQIMRAVATLCKNLRPIDSLLIHVSCHGVLDAAGNLYYATTDSESGDALSGTAIRSEWLNAEMSDSRAGAKVLFLDCCHSGAFGDRRKGAPELNLQTHFKGQGLAVLTASNATEYAYERDEFVGEDAISVFTSAVVEGLRTGDADNDQDGDVSIDDLYQYVYAEVRKSESRQTPQLFLNGAQGRLVVASNPRGPAPKPLPPFLDKALNSRDLQVRNDAVTFLGTLLAGEDGLAATALQLLEFYTQSVDQARAVLARDVLSTADRTVVEPAVPSPTASATVRGAQPGLLAVLLADQAREEAAAITAKANATLDKVNAAAEQAEIASRQRIEAALAQATQLVAEAEQRAAAAEQRATKAVTQAEAVLRDADEHAKHLVGNARRSADAVIAEARAHADRVRDEPTNTDADQLLESTMAQATRLVDEAEQRASVAEQRASRAVSTAEAVRWDADEHAKQLVGNARRNAEAVIAEARSHADKVLTEAKGEAGRTRRDTQRQVDELILQRDSILANLDELRSILGVDVVADDEGAAETPAKPFTTTVRGLDPTQVDRYRADVEAHGYRPPPAFDFVVRGYDHEEVEAWLTQIRPHTTPA